MVRAARLTRDSDGNIRYYEYENDKFEYLSEYKSPDPQRGVAFLPKRGINLHENEVLRCFKTVNDSYIEAVSFIVPRRSEMFQHDIYPPTVGLKPGTTAAEWFAGKTALPPKISLESVYEGQAPTEVPAENKPAATTTASTSMSPTAVSAQPKPEPAPAPVAQRAPSPSMQENKASMANVASKFADKEEESSDASSFEEVPKPADRSLAARIEEKTRGPAVKLEPEPEPSPALALPSPAAAPQASWTASPAAATATSAESPAPTISGAAAGLKEHLHDIKTLLAAQADQLASVKSEVTSLKSEVGTLKTQLGPQRGGDREKDERIRQLELELEEARS